MISNGGLTKVCVVCTGPDRVLRPAHLIDLVGPDVFMFGSDRPHAEGVLAPGESAARAVAASKPTAASAFVSGNARWLLGLA